MGKPKKNGESYYLNTEQEYIDAIKESRGIITTVSHILGLERATVDYRIKNNPQLKELVRQQRESTSDRAEKVIIEKMESGDFEAAKYWLSHMARNRGWGDVTTNVNINANLDIDFDTSKYSLEEKRELLEKLSLGMKKEDEEIIDGNFNRNEDSSESSSNNS